MKQSLQLLYIFPVLLVNTTIETMNQQNAWQKPPNIPGLKTAENGKNKKAKVSKHNQASPQNKNSTEVATKTEETSTRTHTSSHTQDFLPKEDHQLTSETELTTINTGEISSNTNGQIEIKNENPINTTAISLPKTAYWMDTFRGTGVNVLHELEKGTFVNSLIANGDRVSYAIEYFIYYNQPEQLVSLLKELNKISFSTGNNAKTKANIFLNESVLKTEDNFKIAIQKKILESKQAINKAHQQAMASLTAYNITVLKTVVEKTKTDINETTNISLKKVNILKEGLAFLNHQREWLALDQPTFLAEVGQKELVNTTVEALTSVTHQIDNLQNNMHNLLSISCLK